jgi:hypothetical protein
LLCINKSRIFWHYYKSGVQFTSLNVATLALGSRPRQKGLQGCGPKGSPGVTSSNSREFASFDSRPLKVGNRPKILGCRQRATYRWKSLDESYNFASDRTSIRGLLAKLWGFKVPRVPHGGISGLPREKSHLDVGPVESHRVYYKGEGGGFPQVWAVVSLVCPCCPWLVLAPKVLQLCTNHFVWVVCRPVWVNKLVNFS